jgi:UDP-N-acetylmuramoyl-tripeptide--D-alanyl-D-alanine ligase
MLTLADLAESLTGQRPVADWAAWPVRQVVVDSRQASQGCVFVALKGERVDGHDFIGDAIQRGAIAVIAEERALSISDFRFPIFDFRWPIVKSEIGNRKSEIPIVFLVENSLAALHRWAGFWRAKMPAQVVGVTGSVGKTSTKELIWSVLRQRFRTLKSPGNLNNEIGLPLTLLQLTPHDQWAVLEMGMYALGEIAQLCAIARPRIGVITNIGPSHLERLGTLERIAQAKAELVEALPAGGVAILNGDDAGVRAMASRTLAHVFLYGLTPDCDLWASDVVSRGLQGVSFWLHFGGDTVFATVPLLGRHSVHTALRAAAVGLVEGLSWQEIMHGLQNQAAQIRLVVVPGPHGSILLDDTYNASPDSSLAALNLLAEMEGRKIAVLGDMLELGAYAEEGHRKVAARAAETADVFVTVGAMSDLMADEALAAGMAADRVYRAHNNQVAIAILRQLLAPGDFALIKGSRGMEMEEIVAALTVAVNAGGTRGAKA